MIPPRIEVVARRKERVTRTPDTLAIVGAGFYASLHVALPGVVLAYYEGIVSLNATQLGFEFIIAEAKRSGPVLLVSDCEHAPSAAPGVSEAWSRFISHDPPHLRHAHVLVVGAILQMTVSVIRMRTGVASSTYADRGELERALRVVEPQLDLGKLVRTLGR